MKTKEEVIKEAWGIHWNKMDKRGKEQALEDNGYCHKNYVNSEIDFEIDSLHCPDNEFIRPKSLRGIENNNGWIRINSDEDLPKENGVYHVCYSDGTISSRYFHHKHNDWTNEPKATHYQPIVKPNKPLY